MNRLSILAAFAAASFSLSAFAAVYRWVDSEGHVHYTDKAEANALPVDTIKGQPRGAVPLPSGSVPPSSNLTGDQLAQKKTECEQKKKQYDSYKGATKIVETDSLGRQHEFTAEEQKQLIGKTQQQMQETCGAAGVSATSSANP